MRLQSEMQMTSVSSGITVRKLKEIIKDWPEIDTDGNEQTVWICVNPYLSVLCTAIYPLNARKHPDGSLTAAIALVGDAVIEGA